MLRKRTLMGTAVFIPPTSEDPNCITLLHFDGNMDNNGYESYGDTWTKGVNTAYSTSIKRFGTSSVYNTLNSQGSYPSGYIADYDNSYYYYLGSYNNWTAEIWVYIPSEFTGDQGSIFDIHGGYFSIKLGSLSAYINHYDGTRFDYQNNWIYDSNPISLDVWHHFAVVNYNGYINVYVDGVRIINLAWNYEPDFGVWEALTIGQNCPFYFDEFRFSNIARYTGNFTPPTTTFV